MDQTEEPLDSQLWSWVDEEPAPPEPAAVEVIAWLESDEADEREGQRRLLADGRTEPDRIEEGTAPGDARGEWLWLLPSGAAPDPSTLHQLLVAVADQPHLDVIGPLLVEARRRGPGTMVRSFGQTVTSSGRIRSLVEPGELAQGQLEPSYVLGVPPTGMLVRGDLWRRLAGLQRDLDPQVQGLEFGWRATLLGAVVSAEPSAQLIDTTTADPARQRAGELAVMAAHAPTGKRGRRRAGLMVSTVLGCLGFLLGKDLESAAAQWRGLRGWLADRDLENRLAAAVEDLEVSERAAARVSSLRPSPWDGVQRLRGAFVDKIAGWVEGVVDDGGGIDDLTGGAFSGSRWRARVSPFLVGLLLATVGALVAARNSFGQGWLQAGLLLPAPASSSDLLADYLAGVPGSSGLTGPAWTGLAGLASILTLGSPDLLAWLLLVGCVPLAWVGWFVLLRSWLGHAWVAMIAALAIALAPVSIGAVGLGATGVAAWAVTLPLLVIACRSWLAEPGWRRAAGLGLALLIATAVLPLSWPVTLVGLGLAAWRRRVGIRLSFGLVALAPALVLAGPWSGTLMSYPGRLLTGIEPQLAPLEPISAWRLLLLSGSTAGAPLWLSIVVGAGVWLAALAGGWRRPAAAAGWLVAGSCLAVVATVVSWWPVEVAPHQWARASAAEWQVAMVAALVVAAALGLDGLLADLRGASLGLAHLVGLGLSAVLGLSLVLAVGWWVVGGATGLVRGAESVLPAFLRNQLTAPASGRVLALSSGADGVHWSLLEGSGDRWGSVERGLAWGGEAQAADLSRSVVGRLAAGSADDGIVSDLVALGVAAVWLDGDDPEIRTAISNTPGLGLGAGDTSAMTWMVPQSGRLVASVGQQRQLLAEGSELSGAEELWLAEPGDPRWEVAVAGTRLSALESSGPGQRYAAADSQGAVSVEWREGPAWWAWLQLVALAILILLAAPGRSGREQVTSGARQSRPQRLAAPGQGDGR